MGEKIVEKFKTNHEKSAYIIEVVKYVTDMGEYNVQLTNNRRLVLNLSN